MPPIGERVAPHAAAYVSLMLTVPVREPGGDPPAASPTSRVQTEAFRPNSESLARRDRLVVVAHRAHRDDRAERLRRGTAPCPR